MKGGGTLREESEKYACDLKIRYIIIQKLDVHCAGLLLRQSNPCRLAHLQSSDCRVFLRQLRLKDSDALQYSDIQILAQDLHSIYILGLDKPMAVRMELGP